MPKEFKLTEFINLPQKLSEHICGEHHIVIAPEFPNWLILNAEQYNIFSFLKSKNVRAALEAYYADFCQDEERCIGTLTELLEQIDDKNFYQNAKSADEEPIERVVKKVHIGTTNGCNMRCKHCCMAAGTLPLKNVDCAKTIKIIDDLNKMYGPLEIVVSGGEPLTYKDFEFLLKAIKDNHVILFTNGTLIDEKNIDVIAACCDEVQISFEGVSKAAYAKIRGGKNYEKALRTLQLLKTRGIKIVLAVTILPETLDDIESNLLSFVDSLAYKNLEIRITDEIEMSGNALRMNFNGYDFQRSHDVVINLVRSLNKRGYMAQENDTRNVKFTNCGIGTNVVINYDGNIYPCHKFSSHHCNINQNAEDIVAAFNKLNKETSNNGISKCLNCDLRYICSGGCRIDNYNMTGNLTGVICDEEFRKKQYARLIKNHLLFHNA